MKYSHKPKNQCFCVPPLHSNRNLPQLTRRFTSISKAKKLFLLPALIASLGLILSGRATAQTLRTLYGFTATSVPSPGTNNDGALPKGGLIPSGDSLYGTASKGGRSGEGTVFKVYIDGMGFTNLHNFTATSGPSPGINSDGGSPNAGLILSGGILYGTAGQGGSSGNGAVFALNTNGTVFINMHSFTSVSDVYPYVNTDGADPSAGLISSGNTLFGTAFAGGSGGGGTIFMVNTDGNGFATLHDFTNAIDGAEPGELILSSNTLFGTTAQGGSLGYGPIFEVNTDGAGFTNLYNFTLGGDGGYPGGLILSSNTLYGAASVGGSGGGGTIFMVNTDGASFATLHNFTNAIDGAGPEGLILSSNTLYGTTRGGGSSGNGTVFAVNTDGTGFTNLYSFSAYTYDPSTETQVNSDGAVPSAGLVLLGDTLFGTTEKGGSSGNGTLFSLSLVSISAAPGLLQVAVLPAGAAGAGAQWLVDDGAPQITGITVNSLLAGSHTVSFTPISGWNTPPDQMVTITNGVTTWVSGIYTPSNAPPDDLILITNGAGAIHHGAWPESLVIGNNYTVAAAPKAKNVFIDWVGGTAQPYSILSDSATYTFVMRTNLVLEANFVNNVFLDAQGTYRGLFAPTNSFRQQTNSGSFSFNLTGSGGVSGNLDLSGETVPFSGRLSLGGTMNVISKRPHGEPSLTTTLNLNFLDQTVTGTVSDGAFTAELNGNHDGFGGPDKAFGFEGQYTLVIPGTNDSAVGPFGTGYGTVKVGSAGYITLAGSLADGTAISQSSALSTDGSWPLYVSLYGGNGSLWGWMYVNGQSITSSPSLSWINATNPARMAVYRSGFTNQEVTLTGSLYVPTNALAATWPASLTATLEGGNLPFGITNALILKTGGEITPTNTVTQTNMNVTNTIGTNVAVTNVTMNVTNMTTETNKLILTIHKKTGVISGSFANPAAPKQTIKINGVLLQGQTNAQGYFLGTNQSGTFTLDPP
jgi:uncharacterized repeat protein (TIGR03803 family)